MNNTQKANERLVREAVAHIIMTGKPSYNKETRQCVYSGSGCAFFPAIKDEFKNVFDGEERDQEIVRKILSDNNQSSFSDSSTVTADNLLQHGKEYLHEWSHDCDTSFASKIQIAHDEIADTRNKEFVKEFLLRVKQACRHYSVKFPEDLIE